MPITLDVISNILTFATAVSLFLPPEKAEYISVLAHPPEKQPVEQPNQANQHLPIPYEYAILLSQRSTSKGKHLMRPEDRAREDIDAMIEEAYECQVSRWRLMWRESSR